MKMLEDNKTVELLEIPKQKGRPTTGKARSAAQRKADQRSRDLTKVWEESDLSNVTVTGLLAILSQKTKIGWDAEGSLARKVWLEIGKRKGFIS